MNKTSIYTITVVKSIFDNGRRSVGFAHEFEIAERLLTDNESDINEGQYPYAVIEAILPGIYTYPRTEIWYKWNNQNEEYRKTYKPEKFKQISGWCLG